MWASAPARPLFTTATKPDQIAINRMARDLQFVLHNPNIKKLVETQLSGADQQSLPATCAKDIRSEAAARQTLFATMNLKPE